MNTTFQAVLAAVVVTASVAVAVAASAMNTDRSDGTAKGDLLAAPSASSGYVTIATPNAELTILTRVYP
jgi:hypothetical protein